MRRRNQPDLEPKAIDPRSGFEVHLSDLTKQWDGELVDRKRVDRRNPQDFVRGVRDDMALPYARPEVPDRFMASNILWEDYGLLFLESGEAMLDQGEVAEL